MKKKCVFFSIIILSLFLIPCAFAEEAVNAEQKAKEIHELASSDVIYTAEEPKALYYQNLQIIDLLAQIRDLLDMRLKKETKS